jgi:predicted nucleic acid-binding protein
MQNIQVRWKSLSFSETKAEPIALTVRSHGARLITSNRGDFEIIRDYRDFKLEVW